MSLFADLVDNDYSTAVPPSYSEFRRFSIDDIIHLLSLTVRYLVVRLISFVEYNFMFPKMWVATNHPHIHA